MKSVVLALGLLLWPRMCFEIQAHLFIVWNVGQGSWATLVMADHCVHVDMGGESFRFSRRLDLYCRGKENLLALTHLDQDHVNLISKAHRRLPLCLLFKDTFPARQAPTLPACSRVPPTVDILYRSRHRVGNESHVYLLNGTILITGDQPASLEPLALKKPSGKTSRILVAGHHGSRTSSSEALLRRLPFLNTAIVSARKKRYGHPHTVVKKKFRKFLVPLIDTESYGTFVFYLDPGS